MPPAQPACPGFNSPALAGIKSSSRPDLGLVVAEDDVPTAAVFTRNRVRAAPVELSRGARQVGRRRAPSSSTAATPTPAPASSGVATPPRMADYAAKAIGCDEKRVLVASTGVIGQPLPIERIVEATPRLYAAARADGLDDFTRAIMTTDRFEKRALQMVPLGPKTRARVVGVAKGAGMIAPNMATTLAFVSTDAAVSQASCARPLREEVESLQPDLRRRRHLHQRLALPAWRRARPRTSRSTAATRARRSARRCARCSTSWRGRSCATAKAPPTSSPSRCSAPRTPPPPSRWRAASAPRRSSRRRSSAPIRTGAASSAPSATPASTSIPPASTSPSARSRSCRGGVAVGAEAEQRARTRSCAAASTPSACTCTAAAARRAHHLRSHRRLRQAQRRLPLVTRALALALFTFTLAGCVTQALRRRPPLPTSSGAPCAWLAHLGRRRQDRLLQPPHRRQRQRRRHARPLRQLADGGFAPLMVSWLNSERPTTPPDACRWERCRRAHRDAQGATRHAGVAGGQASRSTNGRPTPSSPPIPTPSSSSFSPDGKWLALASSPSASAKTSAPSRSPACAVRAVPAFAARRVTCDASRD